MTHKKERNILSEKLYKTLTSVYNSQSIYEYPPLEAHDSFTPLGSLEIYSEERGLSHHFIHFINHSDHVQRLEKVVFSEALQGVLFELDSQKRRKIAAHSLFSLPLILQNKPVCSMLEGMIELHFSGCMHQFPVACWMRSYPLDWDVWPRFLLQTEKGLFTHVEYPCHAIFISSKSHLPRTFKISLIRNEKVDRSRSVTIEPHSVCKYPLSSILGKKYKKKYKDFLLMIEPFPEKESSGTGIFPARLNIQCFPAR